MIYSKRRLLFFLMKSEGLFLLLRSHRKYLKMTSPGLSIPDSSISTNSNPLFSLSRPFLYHRTSAKIILLVCFAVLPLLHSGPIFSCGSLLKYHRAILSFRSCFKLTSCYTVFIISPFSRAFSATQRNHPTINSSK